MKKSPPSDPLSSQVYIVEASAGSGKTYTLAKRYVCLLLAAEAGKNDIPMRSILAITFTNKAAFEMKARIIELLKMIALDSFVFPEVKNEIFREIGGDPAGIRRRALEALDRLIRNYNFFQVQTIDSFINAILSGCAFKLNLSAGFRIKSDHSECLRYSLDQLIDTACRDKDVRRLFDEFLRQYLFLENKSSWLPKKDILSVLEKLLDYTDIYGGNFTRKISGDSRKLAGLKTGIFEDIAGLGRGLPQGTDKRFQAKMEKLCAPGRKSVELDDVATFFDRPYFPVNKGCEAGARTAALWDKIRCGIRELCETEAFVIFNCYIDIFELFFREFRLCAARDDIVFLSELNRQARSLFDSRLVTVPELYLRLSGRFSNYLLDEFQDTSYLQWKNIFPLIEDGLSCAGSLFYVGDKKQAIYRFRGGEVTLFDQVSEDLRSFRQSRLVLSNNYRSRREIVEFNNGIFSPGNLSRVLSAINGKKSASSPELTPEDIGQITGFFKGAGQAHRPDKTGGRVMVRLIPGVSGDDSRQEARTRLLETVKDLSSRFNYRDIAVLARSNDSVELCASWLLESGIPVESDKTLNIRQHGLIKEFISFLKFLDSPIDNLSFASFISGEIFLSVSGLKKEDIRDFLFDCGTGRRKEKNFYYYRRFRDEFPGPWQDLIEEFFKNTGFTPLYELSVSIIGRLKILENFPASQGFFMRLIELINEQEEDYPAIGSFLDFFDRAPDDGLYVHISEANAVRVLTIHKAKGLEFRAVIVPFLYLDIDIPENIVYSQDEELNLLRLKKEYVRFSPALRNICLQEYKKALIDELNNIYVAFTRARDELYVFVPEKKSNKQNYALMLFDKPDLDRGSPVENPGETGRSPRRDIIFVPPAGYFDWIPLLKDEFTRSETLRNRQSLSRGEKLHLVLSFIKNVEISREAAAVSAALEQAAIHLPAGDATEGLKSFILGCINRQSWRKFFLAGGKEVFTEKEVVDGQGRTKRIDRLIVGEKDALIVDFKSSDELKESKTAQILDYISIIKEIYPEKAVKGYLLYFDREEIEEIDG